MSSIGRRVRRKLRVGLEGLLDRVGLVDPPTEAPVASVVPVASAAPETPVVPVAPAAEPSAPLSPPQEVAPLTFDAVDTVIDELVRPALQADGGDIALIKVEDNDVFVQLLGACNGCPSATVTMRMGIERLLTDEFPQFRSLIEIKQPVGEGEDHE